MPTATQEPPQADLRRGRRQRPERNGVPHPDRLPPHSPEAEQGLLGCLFLDPAAAMPLVIEKLRGQVDRLYDLRNQTILTVMLELWEDQTPIDLISVHERLRTWGSLEQVGGLNYLSTLPDRTPSAANVEHYIDIVRDRYHERRMIHVCTEAVGRIYDHEGDTPALMDAVERDVLQVAESRTYTETASTLELSRRVIHNFETYQSRQGQLIGIDTGYADLNRFTTGLRNGDMIIIAARPSLGKTSLAMNIAEHVAVTNQIPVGVFSLEMTGEALIERMVACRARVNLRSIREGFIAAAELPRITDAVAEIANAPLYIDDRGGQSILEVRAKARRWVQQHQIRLVVIDYLQLMNAMGGKRRYENRQQEVTAISTGVKNLAKELNVPVVVLSQLNRDIERDKAGGRRPLLSDLRESGSLEQDADVVTFLWRKQQMKDEEAGDPHSEVIPTTLSIAKQRNGPTGEVNLIFMRSFTRFESAARVSQEEAPDAGQESLPYNDA